MTKFYRILVVAGSLWAAPALAADNAVIVTPGTGVTVRSVDVGAGVQAPGHAIVNASGTQIGVSGAELFVGGRGTAGSAAGGVLTVQGVASMTPLFMQSATVPVSTMNSASANSGINTALAGVFDDVSPTAITENNFGFLRMSANRNLYGTIRDAAGNERGANVNASNQLSVTGPVTMASSAVASGAYASGAFASGAFASGSIASGALASGSIASGAMVDLLTFQGTKNAGTAAANSLLTGGVYNSTPLTLTNTQQSSLQLDANGYLKVNTAAGAAAGGTSSNFGSAFPTPGTAIGFSDGTNMVAGRVTTYGTAPTGLNAVAVNAFVTNTNANGSATSANSSPVVIASDQAAVAVKGNAANGAAVSGNPNLVAGSDGTNARTILTGTDGRVAANVSQIGGTTVDTNSGNKSAGSQRVVIATDQVALAAAGQVATGAAPPAGVQYIGANTSGATGGLVQGLIQCDSTAIYDASTNGSTELVALTSGRTIYVCGYTILAGGTVNVKLIYGTGTACATGSTNMTPAYQLTAQAGVSDQSPFSRGLKTASANALCINASAGVAAQAIVYYAKL